MSFARNIPKKKKLTNDVRLNVKSYSINDLSNMWGISSKQNISSSTNNIKLYRPVKQKEKSLELQNLNVDQVILLLMILEAVFSEEMIRNNKVNGKALMAVENIDDFKELGLTMPAPKAKSLLSDIIQFRTSGIPGDICEKLLELNTEPIQSNVPILKPIEKTNEYRSRKNNDSFHIRSQSHSRISDEEFIDKNKIKNSVIESKTSEEDKGRHVLETINSIESIVGVMSEIVHYGFHAYSENVIIESINKITNIIMKSKNNQIALGKQGGCSKVNEILKRYNSISINISSSCLQLIATLCRLDGNINTANDDNINSFLKSGCCEGNN